MAKKKTGKKKPKNTTFKQTGRPFTGLSTSQLARQKREVNKGRTNVIVKAGKPSRAFLRKIMNDGGSE